MLLSAMRHQTFTTFTLLLFLAAGLGAGRASGAQPKQSTSPPAAKPTCTAGAFRHVGSAKVAYAAIVRSRAAVSARPGGRVLARFTRLNRNGVPTVFAIRGVRLNRSCRPATYLVQIPQRPNGVTAWVAARQVVVQPIHTRIVVDLSQRRVTLYRSGRRVLSATAAVGSSATPTPTGRFYVNQRLIPTDPHGPFGPGAVGISAYSNVLTGWTQGGPIAIHGTNEPWSIGHAVSNGCIRLRNAVLRRLFKVTPAGTPVIIHP